MMAQSSSSNNDSLHPPEPLFIYMNCFMSKPIPFIVTGILLFRVLLILPVSIIILYLGLRERQKRLSSSAATMSHMDTFTYHLVMMELFGVLGNLVFCCGIHREDLNIVNYGQIGMDFIWYGEILFHVLTCVERYLAVIHPFIYLSLKNERGARIRNISTGCVWLFSFVMAGLMRSLTEIITVTDFCLLFFSFLVSSFCSLSVLCVLIGPSPGDHNEDRERVHRSKRKGFYIILIILAFLVLRFTWDVVESTVYVVTKGNGCVLIICGFWLELPNSLVLPLLFIQRAKK